MEHNEDMRSTERCLQGDQATCQKIGLDPVNPKTIVACVNGSKAACDEIGIPYLNPQLADACAKCNKQACLEIGIDPAQQKLASSCANGDQKSCMEMGMTKEDLQERQAITRRLQAANGGHDSDACEIIMCMSTSNRKAPHQCVGGVKKFFSIRKTKHGHYSAERTANARRDKLKQCDVASKMDIEKVISVYGGLPNNPFRFTLD